MGAADALNGNTNFNSPLIEEMLTISKKEGRQVSIVLNTHDERSVSGIVDSFSLEDGLIRLKSGEWTVLVVTRMMSCMWLY